MFKKIEIKIIKPVLCAPDPIPEIDALYSLVAEQMEENDNYFISYTLCSKRFVVTYKQISKNASEQLVL